MNVIKFSHNYKKLWSQQSAELIAVRDIIINDYTSNDLLEYDTKTTSGEYYKLHPGKHVQLFFLGEKRIPFCTIRSAYSKFGDKRKYYANKIGETFKIVITNKTER